MMTKSADQEHLLLFLHVRASCHVFLFFFLVYRDTVWGGHSYSCWCKVCSRVDQFVVETSPGIRDHEWGCVHTREPWSTKEETHMCPGHNWILKFGNVTGNMTCVEKKFKCPPHKYEECKDLRFRDCDCTLVVDVWLHRVDEEVSGLTFQEWDPSEDTDDSQSPVTMIVSSSEGVRTSPTPNRIRRFTCLHDC